jgi:Fic family protein
MMAALDAFEKYMHIPSDLPPLVRMAILHYQFEAIHPFIDGNGRIGRLLISLMLVTEGLLPQPLLYLSAFFERHRSDYYRLLLQVSQHGNWTDWIIFFLRGVAEQAEDAIVRANKLQKLSSEYREQLQNSRSSAALLKLAERLFKSPMITVQLAKKILGHSQPSAQHNIDRLVAAGILEEITGRQRGRVYVANRIMQIVEDENVQQLQLKFDRHMASTQRA